MNSLKQMIMVCIFMLFAYKSEAQIVHGNVDTLSIKHLYLYEVINEYQSVHRLIDSIAIKNGKFEYLLPRCNPELYFLGTDMYNGGYFFSDSSVLTLTPTIHSEDIIWNVKGSVYDNLYRDYLIERDKVQNKPILDSLDNCFFRAREQNNEQEMKRLKEESIPYYDLAYVNGQKLTEKWIEMYKNNPFGIYLYYFNKFQAKSFPTTTTINEEYDYLNKFELDTTNNRYMSLMVNCLKNYEKSAIGQLAPEIMGVDTLGNQLKLSDFRGSYVLVDFWNSYCHWCREETPALRKALEHLKGKNLRILGVSSDRSTKIWLQAIHEDQSYWDHLILNEKNTIMSDYCITGIPYIILIDPEGKILAKDLRGQELTDVTKECMGL